jgi:hypothetical protein
LSFARAWWIVFSQSVGRWAAPFLFVGILYYAWKDRTIGVTLWPQVSAQIGFGQTLIAPAFVGIAAWLARRERQRSVDELLRTLAASRAQHLAIVWSATAVWALVPYAASGAIIGALAAHSATWGGPSWGPIVAGAAAVVAATTLGFVLGSLLPSALLAPLWAIGWWLLDGYLPLRSSPVQYFAPRTLYENVGRSVYFETIPAWIDAKQSVWWVGLAVFAFALAFAAIERSRKAWTVVAAALPVLIAPTLLLLQTPVQASSHDATRIAYEPVCSDGQVRVCVHPAKERVLDEASASLSAVLSPLAGVPGVPQEAREQADGDRTVPVGVLLFPLYDARSAGKQLVMVTALGLVYERPAGDDGASPPALSFPQAVVGTWLLEQAGYPETLFFWSFMEPELTTARSQQQFDDLTGTFRAATDRFATLAPATRHGWLVDHYLELRQGRVDTSELP